MIQLWQKYNILDQELIDKLNRISATSKLDSALNSSTELSQQEPVKQDTGSNNNLDKLKELIKQSIDQTGPTEATKAQTQPTNLNSISSLNTDLITELHKLTSQLITNSNNSSNLASSAKKLRPSTPPVTSKTEISKILEFDNDFDSDSDNQSNLKRKSISPSSNKNVLLSNSERFKTSINNCAVWLQSNLAETNFKMPDLSQPPPPLMHNYQSYGTGSAPPLPPPPPPPLPLSLPPPPPPRSPPLTSQTFSQKDKDKERQRRGLPNIREKHICSKFLILLLVVVVAKSRRKFEKNKKFKFKN